MLAAARSAHARLGELHDAVSGDLTVSAPIGFAQAHLATALAPLLDAHPELRLRIIATDDTLDLAKERVDVAMTIGTRPAATSLVRRHLADWHNVLVAAPAYLAKYGTPRSAEDLERHVLIALPHWHHPADVLNGPNGQRYRVAHPPRIVSNNQVVNRRLTIAGCGMSFGVVPEMTNELKTKQLVRVLPDWTAPPLSVDVLMLPRAKQPAKVRAAVDALRSYGDAPTKARLTAAVGHRNHRTRSATESTEETRRSRRGTRGRSIRRARVSDTPTSLRQPSSSAVPAQRGFRTSPSAVAPVVCRCEGQRPMGHEPGDRRKPARASDADD